ncbi:Mitochondrial distribution and morphology protein 12 [Kickxella alabastrina]|uniref:Mitochondrial distribution and morphology protein 12 n=1 Tax=Kickxella alabastrina TaxID=61397 RepID=A0ACC1IVM6_9FUNG|nr:Mitochondrial distribution and morphology protein 12 [Kickxella alabastrina]
MSFTIYWEKLDKKVAQSVQAQLNSFFTNLEQRPIFLGEISVEGLDFGSVPPQLEILDLTEPFPEFYLATEDDASNTNNTNANTNANTGVYTVPTPARPTIPINISTYPGAADNDLRRNSEDAYQEIDDDLESVLSQLPGRPLSQATVRRSGAQTPSPRIWNSASVLYQPQQLTGPRPPQMQMQTQMQTVMQQSQFGNSSSSDIFRIMPGEVVVERSEDDMQLTAKVEYCGDMSVVLRTELQLNYPATQFASLPVTLHITKIEFSAIAVVAYLKDRINFCFLEPELPRTSLLDSFSIRTEIGDAHHHVLKNVEKLERFITEQLRKAIDDDFVFPAYHSFEI